VTKEEVVDSLCVFVRRFTPARSEGYKRRNSVPLLATNSDLDKYPPWMTTRMMRGAMVMVMVTAKGQWQYQWRYDCY
jgi:hypothetical protein